MCSESSWAPSRPGADADEAAEQRQHHGLDQELRQDVPGLAPTAMRTPISRVRSVTLTSMMFMMPMPPTSSDTAAIAASRMVSVEVPACCAAATSAMLRIEKSASGANDETWWRSRSRPSISRSVRAVVSELVVAT